MKKWVVVFVVLLVGAVMFVARGGVAKRANAFPPQIATGGGHSCRIVSPGTVECWGANFAGQLGNGALGSAVAVAGPTAPLGANAKVIATGSNHTCVVLTDNTVRCWGANGEGQLGNNTTTLSSTPVTATVTDAKDIAAGNGHTCVVLNDGRVQCWGSNQFGQLGNGTKVSSSVPVAVSNMTDASQVAAGIGHTCVLRTGGSVSCWGTGPLGSGATSDVPVAVPGITSATVVVAGLSNSCALLATGTVSCWGAGSVGELGDGALVSRSAPGPVSGVTGATAIAIGGSHGCAVVALGEVLCWGGNVSGQLGFLLPTNAMCGPVTYPCSPTPAKVPGISGAVDVAVGDSHTCVIFPGARAACWGWNGFGQLGNGEAAAQSGVAEMTYSARPVFVTRKALSVSGNSGGHSCAVLPNGTARCWGENLNGQLGDGTIGTGANPGSATPVAVAGLSNVQQISAGGNHTCALLFDASLRCWGKAVFGQVGAPGGSADKPLPAAVGGPMVVGVGLGRHMSCLIRSGIGSGGISSLRCWGVNNNGQLGVGSSQPLCSGPLVLVALPCTNVPVPAQVTEVVMVRGGIEHTCALRANGAVWCWGQNLFAQLGAGTGSLPRAVLGVGRAVGLAVGPNHNCALLADGTVQCWGDNRQGQVGIAASTNPVTVPNVVTGISDARAVIAGGDFSCALLGNGTIRCWGDNRLGLLGNATAGNGSSTPVAVTGVTDATQIAAAGSALNACAVIESGGVMCWGANGSGELGRGTRSSFSATPAAVIGLP